MSTNQLLEEIKNKNFKMDIPLFLLQMHKKNLVNNYYLDTILRKQIEIIALHKGKSGTELDECVNKEMEHYNNLFNDFVIEDMINLLEESPE